MKTTLCLLLLFPVGISGELFAQDNSKQQYFWANIVGGLAFHDRFLAYTRGVGISFVNEDLVLSARYLRSTKYVLGLAVFQPGPLQTIQESALLSGISLDHNQAFISASAGPGIVWGTYNKLRDNSSFLRLGLSLELQTFIKITSFLGAGVYSWMHLNPEHSFVGVTFSFQLGKFN